MQPRQGVDCSQAKIITLAGVEWFVPLLALRQNRIVIPRILQVLPIIEAAKDPTSLAYIDMFSEETLDTFSRIVHAALTRAYDITYEAFLDLPVNPQDLTAAISVIADATQFFKRKGDPDGDTPAGEQEATT